VNPGDARLLGTRLSQLPRGAVDQLEKVDGTIASQELRPGMWLTEQMLKIPEAVKQSQPVTMLVMHGPIRIMAPGIARQAGAVGDTIRVENAQSQRIVYAKVLSKDEVQVVY
jgi:flagella basal body P-ring formation protein FlgA